MGVKLSEYVRSLPRRTVPLVIGEQTYPLRLTINQLIQVSTVLQRPFEEIAPALREPEVMRAVLWAALSDADPDFSLLDAGDLLLAVGPETIGNALSEAIMASFPEAKAADPQNAARGQDGTGALS